MLNRTRTHKLEDGFANGALHGRLTPLRRSSFPLKAQGNFARASTSLVSLLRIRSDSFQRHETAMPRKTNVV